MMGAAFGGVAGGALSLLGDRRRHRIISYAIGCIAAYIAVRMQQNTEQRMALRRQLQWEATALLLRLRTQQREAAAAATAAESATGKEAPEGRAATAIAAIANEMACTRRAATSTASTQTDPASPVASRRMLPPPVTPGLAPPPLAAAMPPPPPPTPGAPMSVMRRRQQGGGMPSMADLASALGGLKKAEEGGGAGAEALKKDASTLAGARGLGVSLEQIVSVKLRAAPSAQPISRKKAPTPEGVSLRTRLKRVTPAATTRPSPTIAKPQAKPALSSLRSAQAGRRPEPKPPAASDLDPASAALGRLKRFVSAAPASKVGSKVEEKENDPRNERPRWPALRKAPSGGAGLVERSAEAARPGGARDGFGRPTAAGGGGSKAALARAAWTGRTEPEARPREQIECEAQGGLEGAEADDSLPPSGAGGAGMRRGLSLVAARMTGWLWPAAPNATAA